MKVNEIDFGTVDWTQFKSDATADEVQLHYHLVQSFRTIFSVEHAPIVAQAETLIFGSGIP